MIKIYEVLAYNRGIPLFFNQHMERFHQSITTYMDIDLKTLTRDSVALIKQIPFVTGFNIKLSFTVESMELNWEKVKSRKPDEQSYKEGVLTDIYIGTRDTPLIKRENNPLQSTTSQICSEKGLYDVLLKNSEGEITEGSRSNFLIIDKDGSLISSPRGTALDGITRQVIFSICQELNIDVKFKTVCDKDLISAKSLVITGTSPEILPVKSCGSIKFSVTNPVIDRLIKEFKLKKEIDYNLNKDRFSFD